MTPTSTLLLSLLAACSRTKDAGDSAALPMTGGPYTTLALSAQRDCTMDGEPTGDPWDGEGLFPDELSLSMEEDTMLWLWTPDTTTDPPLLNSGRVELPRQGAVYVGEDAESWTFYADCVASSELSLTVQPVDEREALVTIQGETRHDYSCFSEELSVMICAISGAWRLWPPTPHTTP